MKIRGIVKKNLGRGTRLGFPTANLDAPDGAADGIYVALVRLKLLDKKQLALVFVGAAETFGETQKQLEVYILDFNRDLYGQEIEVELLEKIRGSQKFETQDALVNEMKNDEKIARRFFETYGRTE